MCHTLQMNQFPPEVTEALGSYVYLYVDPRNGTPFYVGKGVGNRAFEHLSEEGDSDKASTIAAIRGSGHEPLIEILRHGLSDNQASLVEASAIDLLGLSSLTNQCRGLHARSLGRVSAEDVLLSYSAEPADCIHPMILITINKLYRSGMSTLELYEATRGIWKVGPRRQKAELVCAVYQGVIRETYTVERWQPAGTEEYSTRDDSGFIASGRWEFRGQITPSDVRMRYNKRSVRHLLTASARNPIRYVNC